MSHTRVVPALKRNRAGLAGECERTLPGVGWRAFVGLGFFFGPASSQDRFHKNALEVQNGSIGLLLDRVPDRRYPVNFGIFPMAVDVRQTSSIDSLSFADSLKLPLALKFGDWKAKFLSVVNLNCIHNRFEPGNPFASR